MGVTSFAYQGTIAAVAVNGIATENLIIKSWGVRRDDHGNMDRTYIPHHGEPNQAWWGTSMKGTKFFNWRSWTAVSTEEVQRLALAMGYREKWIQPGWLWENFVFSGIPGFSKLPPGAHLVTCETDDHPVCVLVVHDQNFPCTKTAKRLYDSVNCVGDKSTFAKTFKKR